MIYQTGDEFGDPGFQDREGAAFAGLLPYSEQYRIMEELGLLEKGQVWDELQQRAEQSGDTLAEGNL